LSWAHDFSMNESDKASLILFKSKSIDKSDTLWKMFIVWDSYKREI